MIIVNPLILNREGRFLLIIIIGHDYNYSHGFNFKYIH